MKTVRNAFVGIALAATLMLAACSDGKVIAASSLAAVQGAVDSYLALYAPTWTGTQTVNTAFSKAISDVANWTSGSAGTEVEAALSDLAAALDGIPQLSNKTDEAIGAAINFVDNLITIVQTESAANVTDQPAAFYAWLSSDVPPNTTRKHAWHGKQIKSVKAFQKAWNKSVPKTIQSK